uniref:Lethal giant larvae homologue 2 domain-containing protein n=1 Tax=Panagrolaimus superbus TaxID=310955 RepID=A0A914YC50_9BILA
MEAHKRLAQFFEVCLMCHGFPQKSNCLSIDSELGLLAIGTKDGRIKIVGSENVEWSGHLKLCSNIKSLQFVPDTGSLMLVSEEPSSATQSIHRVQIENDKLDIQTVSPPPFLKKINSSCVVFRVARKSFFLLGTISGNLYNLNISTLHASDFVVYDDLMGEDGNELETSQRMISYLNYNSLNDLLLVVVNNIYLIVYDISRMTVAYRIKSKYPITTAEFDSSDASMIVIAFENGSYSIYKYSYTDQLILTPLLNDVYLYGKESTTPIKKASLMINNNQNEEETLIFIGGMPESTCGEKYTITVKNVTSHVAFDFDSPIVDFEYMIDGSALFVLCEQELVVIDLIDPEWKPFPLPYLYPLHCSPISCSNLISNVRENVYLALCDAGIQQLTQNQMFSLRQWPLMCGYGERPKAADLENRECTILITGHEDGSIMFWKANSVNLKPLLIYRSAKDFEGYSEPNPATSPAEFDEDSELPPLRKAGLFETFCDDPRFAIQKLAFDEKTGNLVIGGRGGHVIVYELNSVTAKLDPLTVIKVDMIEAVQNYQGNPKGPRSGEAPLPPRKMPISYAVGIRPSYQCMIQLKPAVPIHALAWNSENDTVAVGIEFGYVVCDLKEKQITLKNSLLPAEDIIEIVNNDGQLSRFKSVKKTIRQSFRRKKRPMAIEATIPEMGEPSSSMIENFRPTEREIVARPKNATYNVSKGDTPPSSIRMLRFLKHNFGFEKEATLLFVGTSGGRVFIYQIEKNRGATEQFLAVLTHRGEIFIFSPWNLKKLVKIQFTKCTDGTAINSASLAKDGALFWLRPGGSEFQRAAISACSNYGLISPFRDRNLV